MRACVATYWHATHWRGKGLAPDLHERAEASVWKRYLDNRRRFCDRRPVDLVGTWRLVAWRRITSDGAVSFPLGQDAQGTLVYARDGGMSVVLTAAARPPMGGDPLGGDVDSRARCYSTCLAYAGSYEVHGETVIHSVSESLYPNWSGTSQPRTIDFQDGDLVLSTPSQPGASGGTVNEIVWSRVSAPPDGSGRTEPVEAQRY